MSDRWITFDAVLPAYLLLAIMLCFTTLFVVLELKSAMRYRTLRLAALVLMLTALTAILLRPARRTPASASIILLTPAYNAHQADSLLRLHPNATIVHTTGAKPFRNSKHLVSYHQLNTLRGQLKYVLGQGLTPAAHNLITQPFTFLPSPTPAGIVALSIQQPVIAGRSNTIEGVIHNASASEKLYLLGPGGKEDSVALTGKGFERFQLTFTPKRPGEFVYSLGAGSEPVPVHAKAPAATNILFIQHFPTFEARSLKNFLGEAGHHILFRYQLSRNKYRYEFINRKPQQAEQLTEQTLAAFDLLIIDTDALQSLSAAAVRDIKHAVQNGLGLIVLFNSTPLKIKTTVLPDGLFTAPAPDTATLQLGARRVTLPAWPVKTAYTIQVVPVLKNKNRLLTGYRYEGFGKTGFQLLQETYQLSLEGDSVAYSEVWSDLVGKTARTKKDKYIIRLADAFPLYENYPVRAEVIAAGPQPVLYNDSTAVPLTEDTFVDDVWKADVWAGKPGWHTLSIEGDASSLRYYVFNARHWPTIAAANAVAYTAAQAGAAQATNQGIDVWQPLPQWIFYLLFMLGAGVLWLVPKL